MPVLVWKSPGMASLLVMVQVISTLPVGAGPLPLTMKSLARPSSWRDKGRFGLVSAVTENVGTSLAAICTANGAPLVVVAPSAPLMAPKLNWKVSAPSPVASSRVHTVTSCAVWLLKVSVAEGNAPNAVVSAASPVARKSSAAASAVAEALSTPMFHGTDTVLPLAIVPPPGVTLNTCELPSVMAPLAGVLRATVKVSASLSVICTAALPAPEAMVGVSVPVGLDKVTVRVSAASFTPSSVTLSVMVCAVAWLPEVKVSGLVAEVV